MTQDPFKEERVQSEQLVDKLEARFPNFRQTLEMTVVTLEDMDELEERDIVTVNPLRDGRELKGSYSEHWLGRETSPSERAIQPQLLSNPLSASTCPLILAGTGNICFPSSRGLRANGTETYVKEVTNCFYCYSSYILHLPCESYPLFKPPLSY